MKTNRHVYRRSWTTAIAAAMSITMPAIATAQTFEDCAVIPHSQATPFIQSRTQLAILNVEISQGNPCQLIEFRFAEMDGEMDVQVVNDVQIRTWKETWGVTLCDEPVAYNVWYKEIGLGGMSYQVLKEEYPRRTFLRRVADAVPGGTDAAADSATDGTDAAGDSATAAPTESDASSPAAESDEDAVAQADKADETEPPTSDAAADASETGEEGGILEGLGSLFSDDADAKEPVPTKEVETTPAPPVPVASTNRGRINVLTRTLALSNPPMKGHDVCAVQRALLGKGHEITIDGVFGPGMKKAIGKFQKDAGLESSGSFDEATRQALAANVLPVSSGDNSQPDDPGESDE